MSKILTQHGERDKTSEEQADYDAMVKRFQDAQPQIKLEAIRKIRKEFFEKTDYLALSDTPLTEEMKTFRQNLRNIPQDYSEADYDDLLARDEQGHLTHTVWSKP